MRSDRFHLDIRDVCFLLSRTSHCLNCIDCLASLLTSLLLKNSHGTFEKFFCSGSGVFGLSSSLANAAAGHESSLILTVRSCRRVVPLGSGAIHGILIYLSISVSDSADPYYDDALLYNLGVFTVSESALSSYLYSPVTDALEAAEIVGSASSS